MEKVDTPIEGVFILEASKFVDDRGSFSELFNKKVLVNLGISFDIAQINHAVNGQSGIMRGLHFQKTPHAQAKIVYCIRGRVMDCALDINKNSKTFGKYFLCELFEGDGRALYLSEDMAHGYLTLEPDSEVIYLTSDYYHKESEGGIRFDDPAFAIAWPKVEKMIITERDANWPDFV